jgi:hypothetical protein
MILKLRKSDSDANSHKTMESGKRAKRQSERMNAKLNWEKTQQGTLWRGDLLLLVTNPHRRRRTQERPRNKGEDEMIAKTRNNNNNIRQTQANNSSPRAQERHKQMHQKCR